MSNQTAIAIITIVETLQSIAEFNGVEDFNPKHPGVLREIESKLQQGWLSKEIISHFRNFEEINPQLDEDTACNNMARIEERVAKRLQSLNAS